MAAVILVANGEGEGSTIDGEIPRSLTAMQRLQAFKQ